MTVPSAAVRDPVARRPESTDHHQSARHPDPPAYRVTKRVIDLSVAGMLVVLLSPLLVLMAAVIRLTSRGPAIFRQERVGCDGAPFTCLKFRTMRVAADDAIHRRYVHQLLQDSESSADGRPNLFKLTDDPRITRIGGVLRRTSVDELPQLVNVLRGEMSLVGPRPMLAWEADLLEPWQRERFSVKPGLTGLWQVSGRSTVSVRDALVLDVDYVRRRSLGLDLMILAKTPAAVLRTGAAA